MEIFFSLFVSSRSLAGGDVRGCVFRERGGCGFYVGVGGKIREKK